MLFSGFVIAAAILPTVAQSTESDIRALLVGKPLYLRGCWRVDKLTFDADGQPQKSYKTTAPTEAGFEATSVKLRGNRLRIEGQRIVVAFDPKGKTQLFRWVSRDYSGEMTIDIAGAPGADFGKALNAVFSAELIHLPAKPPESAPQNSGRPPKQPGPNTTPTAGGGNAVSDAARLQHIGGTVKPPRVLKSVDPEFSEAARALKYNANVQVYLWVDETGIPSHIKVIRPVGMGLDEQSVAAVQQYRFAPATRDGVPVKVDLYIDVNFQIF
ncbi:MAG TPA: energy transducer TonB [Acidobacteriaceae bacterium]